MGEGAFEQWLKVIRYFRQCAFNCGKACAFPHFWVPVRCPRTILRLTAGGPREHCRVKGKPNSVTELFQHVRGVGANVGGIDHDWRLALRCGDFVKQCGLIFKAHVAGIGVFALFDIAHDHPSGMAYEEHIGDVGDPVTRNAINHMMRHVLLVVIWLAFPHAIAKEKTGIINRDLGLIPANDLAVHIDLDVAIADIIFRVVACVVIGELAPCWGKFASEGIQNLPIRQIQAMILSAEMAAVQSYME